MKNLPRQTTAPSGMSAYAADGAGTNPYAGVGTDPAYQMDSDGADAPYTDYGTFATTLRPEIGNTPDPDRLDRRTRVDARADLRAPLKWWQRRNSDVLARHSVEEVDADGRAERQSVTHYGSDPRWSPPPSDRLTGSLSPSSYSFMRPFDQSVARRFTGDHFSMANHKRVGEIFGMEPVSRGRNTYRIEPKPWDTDIVDEPPSVNDGMPYQHVRQFSVPGSATSGRRWSL